MRDPKKMKDWTLAVRIAQRIVLINLIALCTVMVFLILERMSEPTAATPLPPQEAPSVFDRAQKND